MVIYEGFFLRPSLIKKLGFKKTYFDNQNNLQIKVG